MKDSLLPEQQLRRRTLSWAVRLRVNPRVVRVQPMRRKWGSCSIKGTVTLALDLVDEPTRFQDFVICHELLHLRLPNHGRLFKTLLSAYVPGWRELQVSRRD
ncbi:MAG: M48 family metallopeptidase [Myxococcaceae bacterium]